jgi:hypothetical protein
MESNKSVADPSGKSQRAVPCILLVIQQNFILFFLQTNLVGIKERIANADSALANVITGAVGSMSRSENGFNVDISNVKMFAVLKQLIPLRAVGLEELQIENGLERLLHFLHARSNAQLDSGKHLAKLLSSRDVISVHLKTWIKNNKQPEKAYVRLQNPLQMKILLLDVMNELVHVLVAGASRVKVEIEHRIDHNRLFRLVAAKDPL